MKRKNESGVVVVEALIVVTIAMMFVTVMLYLGMFLYQQAVVNIMANQTASSIAQIYGNTLRDPFTGYVDAEGINETVTYANARNEAYNSVIKQKANAFALYRLKSSRILNTGTTQVDVSVVAKPNELLKNQIEVTIRDDYAVSLVSFFGINDNSMTFVGTGRADCTDRLEYFTGVPALGTSDGNAVIFTKEERECTVNFYRHYGEARPLKTVTVLQGYSVNSSAEKSHSAMPAKPAQEKMRFVKWITEEGYNFNGGSVVNQDMNVYGVWECTVTFDPDGGTVSQPSMTATVYGNLTLPVAERENCTFAGWYTEKNGKGEEFTGVNVQGDITVYAKWLCTVSFNPDGGEVSPDSVDVLYGQSLSEAGADLPVPTRTGCTFDGWYTEAMGGGNKFAASEVIQGHKTVIAKWNCNVKFLDDDGKTPLFDTQTVVAGKTADMPKPERNHSEDNKKGWQFLGWKDAEGTNYDNNTVIRFDVDLLANWKCEHVYEYVKTITEATCEKDGKYIEKCKYCDTEREGILKNFGGHKEGDPKIVNPGCTSRGLKQWYCTKCNVVTREETLNELGHDISGNCGKKHYLESIEHWKPSEYHNVEHDVYWIACIVCVRCGHIDYDRTCGTCYENSPNHPGGWGQWKTFVDIHKIGRRQFG